jgi:hypothetical protein
MPSLKRGEQDAIQPLQAERRHFPWRNRGMAITSGFTRRASLGDRPRTRPHRGGFSIPLFEGFESHLARLPQGSNAFGTGRHVLRGAKCRLSSLHFLLKLSRIVCHVAQPTRNSVTKKVQDDAGAFDRWSDQYRRTTGRTNRTSSSRRRLATKTAELEELAGDWRRLDQRIDGLSGEIEALARQDQACSRLMAVQEKQAIKLRFARSPLAGRKVARCRTLL